MKPKNVITLPQELYTPQFLRFAGIYAKRFIANSGYGKWLVEYQKMEQEGDFEPVALQGYYADILRKRSHLSYICWEAVNHICIQALDAAKTYISTSVFDIRVFTGQIAVDDNDKELVDLGLAEARMICEAMNEEAEEELFVVYNSSSNKPVK